MERQQTRRMSWNNLYSSLPHPKHSILGSLWQEPQRQNNQRAGSELRGGSTRGLPLLRFVWQILTSTELRENIKFLSWSWLVLIQGILAEVIHIGKHHYNGVGGPDGGSQHLSRSSTGQMINYRLQQENPQQEKK